MTGTAGTRPAATGATGREVVLAADGLVKHYPVRGGRVLRRGGGAVRAVDGVELTLRRGEALGIVGESGCGKSTLARLLVGLETPTAGRIVVLGEDLGALDRAGLHRARRDVQIVMQDPYSSLNPRMTVGDILGEPFVIHPDVVAPARRRERVRELMDLVGLNPDHLNRYPHQFSGGQRQRLGIARALALHPRIVVLDEPVSALDVSVQAQVVNLLRRLRDHLDLSYVFIAHDLSVVRHLCDRIAVMYLGRVAELGPADEVYHHPTHPYTQALLSAVPVPDPARRGRGGRIVLDGEVPSPVDPPSGCRFRTRCWRARALCADQQPALVPRECSPHPSACHFAAERDYPADGAP